MISIFDEHDMFGPLLIPDDARAELRFQVVGPLLYIKVVIVQRDGKEVLWQMHQAQTEIPCVLNIQQIPQDVLTNP